MIETLIKAVIKFLLTLLNKAVKEINSEDK